MTATVVRDRDTMRLTLSATVNSYMPHDCTALARRECPINFRLISGMDVGKVRFGLVSNGATELPDLPGRAPDRSKFCDSYGKGPNIFDSPAASGKGLTYVHTV